MFSGATGSYSDTEPEVFYPYFLAPPPFGTMGRSAGLARMRFSSGSLQLDEEEEEDEEEQGKGVKVKKEVRIEVEKKDDREDKGPSKITKITL